jgi:glycosyltransferase involved in cell wall biosynthesis
VKRREPTAAASASASGVPAAFYTPLKHPRLPEASGDREIARALMAALRVCGFAPELASRLLTWRRGFDAVAVERIERRAAIVAATLIRRYRCRAEPRRPRVWISYQNYHRCPDLLGPVVTTALQIPYVLVDTATSTRSRRTPFRPWASAARLAIRRADLIFAMSPRDLPRLGAFRGPGLAPERLRLLPPAVDLDRFGGDGARRAADRARLGIGTEPLVLCVAMMRTADKLDSYRLLAAALARLAKAAAEHPWRLLVVGDGPARPTVEALLAPLGSNRVRLAGAVPPEALPAFYRAADVFAFPGLGEALGLVYLEAAAAGLPIVACQGPGPEFMVPPEGGLLTPPNAEAFAEALRDLLDHPCQRERLGRAARAFVEGERTTAHLAARLRDGLAGLGLP